jgi:Protein of unknown function (DUF3047)
MTFLPETRSPRHGLRFRVIGSLLCGVLLGACSTPKPADPLPDLSTSPWAVAGLVANVDPPSASTRVAPSSWNHFKLPGKQMNTFTPVRMDNRDAMLVQSNNSASMLRQKVRIAPHALDHVKFSWKVPALIAKADMALRHADDSPARIVLAFEGDRSRFSGKNAMLSELSHTLTGEPLPYATLMYVWCNTRAPGSVIVNPRTDRIRKIVVESGAKNLNQWLDYERNIRADFEKAFGEPPGALVGIGIMTDTDNTHGTASAWYGKVKFGTADASAQTGKPQASTVVGGQ